MSCADCTWAAQAEWSEACRAAKAVWQARAAEPESVSCRLRATLTIVGDEPPRTPPAQRSARVRSERVSVTCMVAIGSREEVWVGLSWEWDDGLAVLGEDGKRVGLAEERRRKIKYQYR